MPIYDILHTLGILNLKHNCDIYGIKLFVRQMFLNIDISMVFVFYHIVLKCWALRFFMFYENGNFVFYTEILNMSYLVLYNWLYIQTPIVVFYE